MTQNRSSPQSELRWLVSRATLGEFDGVRRLLSCGLRGGRGQKEPWGGVVVAAEANTWQPLATAETATLPTPNNTTATRDQHDQVQPEPESWFTA